MENSNKIRQTIINKTDLKVYIPHSSKKQYKICAAAAAVTIPSNSISQLDIFTSQLQTIHKIKTTPHGHPNSAATSNFLSKQHQHLGTALPNEETRVGYANTTTMDSVTTQQLQLPPELPIETQKSHDFNQNG